MGERHGMERIGDVIAFIIVLVISVYSRQSHAVPSPKNRVFRLCLATTLGAIGTNLACDAHDRLCAAGAWPAASPTS